MIIIKNIYKSAIFLVISMVIFCIFYSIIFMSAKYGSNINIKASNNIFMYDKDGKSFYEGNNGTKKWIKLNNISKYLIKSTIYSEDKNFYKHNGFDIPRIVKSIFINLKQNDLSQGGSTITQQYARNIFLSFDKNWKRKFKEAWIAYKLEVQYSKDDILEGYLNTINYGNGILGIENASMFYFNKSAKDLDLAESAMLAGIPKSPNNYSPLNSVSNAKKRQKEILNILYNNNIISNKQRKEAYNKKLVYYGKKENLNLSTIMYYQNAVIRELKSLNIIDENSFRENGLKIYTNFDIKAQSSLERAIKNNIEQNDDMQVSAIVSDPNDGRILALAGGKDYSKSQYNRAIQSKRQIGSTMKPILYYAALENGLTSASTFLIKPTTFKLDNGQTYSPNNFGNKYPNDKITMALAIAYSDNIYAIKTHLFLGENTLPKYAKKMGLRKKLEANVSLPLGTDELSIIDFTNMYSTIANSGYSVKGHLINKIENGNGKTIYKYQQKRNKVLNSSYTYILNNMLSNTYDSKLKSYTSPTCSSISSRLTKKYAVKSGTTDYDLWTVGYNPNILVSVWTGYDDNRKLGNKYNNSKKIWADTIEGYLRDDKTKWYKKPKDVVGVITNLNNGKVAKKSTKLKKILYFIKGTEPN